MLFTGEVAGVKRMGDAAKRSLNRVYIVCGHLFKALRLAFLTVAVEDIFFYKSYVQSHMRNVQPP